MLLHLINDLNFRLSEHPSVVNFRWSPTESWGGTWSFLIAAVSIYVVAAAILHGFLLLLGRRKAVPIGPIPALHSLAVFVVSAAIFTGMLSSAVAEIRDTRWLWRRSRTPFQWLLCFPLGTRPSGRVFFWSYVFYLSRFLHAGRTFLAIVGNPNRSHHFRVLGHSVLIVVSFLWLEFSQSIQVLAILSMSLAFTLVSGYRFLTETRILQQSHLSTVVMLCQVSLATTSLAWHVGALALHMSKGGCNGIGAWVVDTVLNSFVLISLMNFYVSKCLGVVDRDFVDRARELTNSNTIIYKRLNSGLS